MQEEQVREKLIQELSQLRQRCELLERANEERRQSEQALSAKTVQLEAIHKSLVTFLGNGDWREASACLLRAILEQTSSEYGFIGVVVEGPILRILAHEGIQWDRTTNRALYESAMQRYDETGYLDFTNFENLFGRAIITGKPVLANNPSTDPRSGGLPPGHPPLRHFLAVPALKGGEVVGLIGIANRPGGYAGTEQTQLEVLTEAVSALYESYRRSERELALEARVRERQKLETLGQLAGGIAHDFNNIIMVINGYTDLLQTRLKGSDLRQDEVVHIQDASRRAAALTRQLLAFSRRQPTAPREIDVNAVLTETTAMLKRVIHSHIAIQVDLTSLEPVLLDDAQFDQILINLLLNAQDAMPHGGKITIATAMVVLDTTFCDHHPGSREGRHILLSVTDTGHGMDAPTQARIFEPFFTTKESGKGTGLGLATVYGIMKQCGGYIEVASTIGQGTTFKVYFPSATANQKRAEAGVVSHPEPIRILLVEDETMIRNILRETLIQHGYEVVEAASGPEALARIKTDKRRVALLISDIKLDGINGLELGQRVKVLRPTMKELYISDSSEDLNAYEDGRIAKVNFLPKPFTPSTLINKIEEVLSSE